MRKKKAILLILGLMCLATTAVGIAAGSFNTVNAEVLPSDTNISYVNSYTDVDGDCGVRLTKKVEDQSLSMTYWNYLTKDELANGFSIKMSPEEYKTAEATKIKVVFEDALDSSQKLIVGITQGNNWYGIESNYGFGTLGDDFIWNNNTAITTTASGTAPILGNGLKAGAGYTGNGYFNIGEFGSYNGVFVAPTVLNFSVNTETGDVAYVGNIKDDSFQAKSTEQMDKVDDAELISRYTDGYVTNLFSSGYVKISFIIEGLRAQSVSLMVVSVGGKNIDTVKDTTAPIIENDLETNAIKGIEYRIPDFSLIENYGNAAHYTMELVTPSGAVQDIQDTFLPVESGEYVLSVTALDEAGNQSEKSYKILCFDEIPEVSFVKTSDAHVEEAYIVNETITLPVFEGRSGLSRLENGGLKTTVKILCDEEVVYEKVINNETSYKLQKAGSYKVLYESEDSFGNKTQYMYTTFEAEDWPYIGTLAPIYVNIGELYIPEELKCIYLGDYYDTVYSVYDENGNQVDLTNGGFVPNTLQNYKVVYTASVDGKIQTEERILAAAYIPGSIFEYDKNNVSVINDYPIPKYSSHKGNGVYVKVDNSNKIVWERTIDLSQLSLKDNIVEWMPYAEDNCLEANYTITLTDVHNEKNKVSIRYLRHASLAHLGYANISYDGRRLARSSEYNGAIMESQDFGTLIVNSFGRLKDGTFLSLRMDYSENRFYINDDNWFLLDLDDGSQVGYGKEWSGFTTGEVILQFEVECDKIGGCIITEVGGMKLGGYTLEDKTAPYLYFDASSNFIDNNGVYPVAKVNEKYPLLTAVAYDNAFGECDVDYTIYYNGETTNLYDASSGGVFIPTREGVYTYIISAQDPLGNKAMRTGEFTALSQISEIVIGFEDFDESQLVGGNYFKVPNIKRSGGSGLVTYQYNVTLNGAAVAVEDCGEIYLEQSGDLVFEFTATDYLGTTVQKNWAYVVSAESLPVIRVNGIPISVVYGDTVYLPDFTATDFNYAKGEKGYDAYRCIKINGALIFAGQGGKVIGSRSYVVNETEYLTVEYWAGNDANNLTAVKVFKIPVIKKDSVANYIVPTDYNESCKDTIVENRSSENGIGYVVNGNKAFTILNPVATRSLALRFSGIEGYSGQEYTDIRLTDYNDSRNQIVLRIKEVNGAYYLNINGNSSTSIKLTGSMAKLDSYITLEYSQEALGLLDENGNVLVKFDRNVIGNEFEGFSGLAIVSFELVNVTNQGSINIYQVGNQIFSQADKFRDIVGPQIWYERKMSSTKMMIGDKLIVSKAYAQDVLSGSATVTVTINTPKGIWNGVSGGAANKEYNVTLDAYGYYTIIYKAIDANGAETTERFVYYCQDIITPQLTVNGQVATSIIVGEKLELPSANYSDNYSNCTLSIIVISPDGASIKVDDNSFKPVMIGTHYVVYYLVDADYNISVQKFKVEVVK